MRFAVAGGALIAALALAEIGHRAWRNAHGQTFDEHATRAAFERVRSDASDAASGIAGVAAVERPTTNRIGVLDPYSAFDVAEGAGQIEAELHYLAKRGSAAYPILVLGGSVAGVFTQLGGEAFLDAIWNDPRLKDRHPVLLNHARGGYKQPQQASRLVYLLALGYQPSAVINIDGFNDVAIARENAAHGSHPLHPSHTHWAHWTRGGVPDRATIDRWIQIRTAQASAARIAGAALDFGLWRSSLASTWVKGAMHRALERAHAAQTGYAHALRAGAHFGPALRGAQDDAWLGVAVDGWANGSLCIRALCEARSIPYLHVLQPTLHDAGSKRLTADEIAAGAAIPEWIDGVQKGYPLLRARASELRARGMHVFDATRIFAEVDESLYYDACHFGPSGNALFARELAHAFLDALPASVPLEAR